MNEIAISTFKANCSAILKKLRNTNETVVITRFGKPVVELSPPTRRQGEDAWIGSMSGEIQFLGDIVAPVLFSEQEKMD